jgi:hypothetical protein
MQLNIVLSGLSKWMKILFLLVLEGFGLYSSPLPPPSRKKNGYSRAHGPAAKVESGENLNESQRNTI